MNQNEVRTVADKAWAEAYGAAYKVWNEACAAA